MPYQSVAEVARQHFPELRSPKAISDLFYAGKMPDADRECPVIGGRRLIPPTYIETIRLALVRSGKLSHMEVSRA